MKRFIKALAVVSAITLMTGCGDKNHERERTRTKDSNQVVTTNPDVAIEIPEFSSNIYVELLIDGEGYGTEIDCMAAYAKFYTDGTVYVYMDDTDKTFVTEFTLSDEDYSKVEESVDRVKLYTLDVESDMDVCDGNSQAIRLYDSNDEFLVSKGAYMARTPEFCAMDSALFDILREYDVFESIGDVKYSMENDGIVEVVPIVIPYVGDEYYAITSVGNGNQGDFHTLKEESSKENDITDLEDWFEENMLVTPDGYYIEDGTYTYYLTSPDAQDVTHYYEPTMVIIYDEMFDEVATLDFSEYSIPAEIKPGDEPFVYEYVSHVESKDDVLYVSISHRTYAESAPSNAYILAIDLSDYSVIWRSDNLVSNASNFAIVDDTIFAGYGFTKEPDYIYAINRIDGTAMDRYDLASGPDYLIEKDGKLYVRTYDHDYVFSIE